MSNSTSAIPSGDPETARPPGWRRLFNSAGRNYSEKLTKNFHRKYPPPSNWTIDAENMPKMNKYQFSLLQENRKDIQNGILRITFIAKTKPFISARIVKAFPQRYSSHETD